MKLADYVINRLADEGIDKIFLVYGSAVGDLVDAFTRTDRTRYVAVLHEQAGGYMAEGYAKVKGKPGVAIATSGPGGMNLVTPIGNCFYDSVPCIFLVGQVNSRFLRPDPSIRQIGFQETDIVSIVKPITKYAKMVARPEDMRHELEKALCLCVDGRPGPVLLDLPIDIQRAEIDPERLVGFNPMFAIPMREQPNSHSIGRQVRRLAEDLSLCKRPVLLVGGGARSAAEKVRKLAERIGAPCFPTWNALDIITDGFPYYGGRVGTYGGAGRNFGVQNCDLLLAIGSRISGRITGGNPASFARGAKKYAVDVDPALLQPKLQQVPFDVNVLCDAGAFCDAMLDEIVMPMGEQFRSWMRKVAEWRDKYDPVRPEYFDQKQHVHPYAFVRTLSRKMGPADVLVADCGGNIVVCNHAFETKWGQRYITNNGNSPMGFSMCGAMGAWFADPSRRVVCVIGDGGMNMNLQELQTIKRERIDIKVFILNNRAYGITKQYQEINFGGRQEACAPGKGYEPPDFVRVAEAYGLAAVRIRDNAEMGEGIDEVLGYPGPIICDVDCGDHHDYTPRLVGWNCPIEDMDPKLPRDEFRANMIVDPLPGWEKGEY